MTIEWLEIVGRIESGENARTEFKRGFDRSAISRTLCAFANGDGGLLVLGVDDSQNIVGVEENTEKVQEKLTSILQNSCGRPISAECDRFKSDEGGYIGLKCAVASAAVSRSTMMVDSRFDAGVAV